MKKILIVDDSAYMRMFLKKIIRKAGAFLIYEAPTKDDAKDMFRIFQPEIVTLDLNISDNMRDGIDVLKHIMDIKPDAVVIIVSASADKENFKNECIALGAKDLIQKPFDTEILLDILDKYK